MVKPVKVVVVVPAGMVAVRVPPTNTRYPVTGCAGVDATAVQDTPNVVLPGVTATPVGVPGAPTGVPVTALDDPDCPAGPNVATVIEYVVPLVRPVSVAAVVAAAMVATCVPSWNTR